MDSSSIIGLVNNAALLLALALLYDMTGVRLGVARSTDRLRQVLSGIILGAIGIAIMLNPWDFGYGITFDTRSVLLCTSGLFFGTLPVFIAVAITAGFRLLMGGSGTLTGVAVIVTSGAIGLSWRHFRKDALNEPSMAQLYLLGIVVHLTMLACMVLLPRQMIYSVLREISLPVMVIYPVATAVLGNLMVRRTRRARVEQALSHSHELMRYIIENVNSAVAVHDRDLKYLYVSRRYLKDYNVEEKDVIGRHHYDVFPDLPDKWRKAHQKALKGEVTGALRDPFMRRDGSVEWTRWECRPWYEADGDIGGIIVYTEIITQQVEYEEKLRESLEFQRALIAASPVAILSLSPDGLVKSWNQAAEKIFGWTEKEVLGRFLPIVSEDQKQSFQEFKDRVVSGRSFSGVELIRYRKDGAPVEISLSTAPVRDNQGKVSAIVSIIEDITERKHAEKERDRLQARLIQAGKMESVGRLAGGIAHDFNNMLNVILGYTELALEKVNPHEGLCTDLKEVRQAARRSAQITSQLLAFSRQQTIAPRILDLNKTVEGMLRMLKRLIGEDIDLQWYPEKNIRPVSIDPGQVDQILVNLCVNARDAIGNVGKITIETNTRVFDEDYCAVNPGFVPGDFVLLSVSDDGPGMDKQTRDRLFEPFFTTKKLGKGTGLGLATVYGIVRQNNGFINVYSEPDSGTTLKIYLPGHDDLAVQKEEKDLVSEDIQGTETILLVEDEHSILRMTTMMLKKQGYNVLTAQSPAKAVEIADSYEEKIDLLITDVVMPEMNGRQLAEKLQAQYPDIRVLYMSGYTSNVIAHRGVLDQGVAFIQKPFSKKELAIKVRQALI